MLITGTHFNYYQIYERKLWLFANSIQMEHTNDLVSEGKLIHETTHPQRSTKYEEVAIGGIKVDYYDPKNKYGCYSITKNLSACRKKNF